MNLFLVMLLSFGLVACNPLSGKENSFFDPNHLPFNTSNKDNNNDPTNNQPVYDNVIATGLVLNLDAAFAKSGNGPFTTCDATALTWFDIGSFHHSASLSPTTDCSSTSGWTGTGSVSHPYALILDGIDDGVDLGDQPEFDMAGAFSIEAWINSTDVNKNYGFLISKGTGAANNTNYEIRLSSNTGRLEFYTTSGVTYISCSTTTVLQNNRWYKISLTYDGTTHRLYINDTQECTAGTAGVLNTTATALQIGRRVDGYHFEGQIPIVRLYNRSLSAAELRYNCLLQEARFTNTPNSICGP